MTIQTLTYEAPVRHSVPHPMLNYELLDSADELAQQGESLLALQKVIEHLLPSSKVPNLLNEALVFTQGSSNVTIKIEGDELVIRVPLIRLPEGGRAVAALRYVLTQIAGTGRLFQPRLVKDDIHIEYRDALSRLHPAKVLEVLRRMPEEADNSDDLLIGQFGALPLERASITPLDDAELDRCETIWKSHWVNLEELVKECQRKRSLFFLNELTAYAPNQVLFTLPLSGYLAHRLSEFASTFNNSNEEPLKREASLLRCIKEMKAVSREELQKSVGHASYAINPLWEGTSQALGRYLAGGYIETVNDLRRSGNSFDAAFGLIGTYTYLLARFSWPEALEEAMKESLIRASGKPWKEAASILCAQAERIIAQFAAEEAEDKEDANAERGEIQ
jgi:hypothetical protein